MRTIKLDISVLADVIEGKSYVNRKGDRKRALKSVNYMFTSNKHSCIVELYIDEDWDIHVTRVNDTTIGDDEYPLFYHEDGLMPIKDLYLAIFREHGLMVNLERVAKRIEKMNDFFADYVIDIDNDSSLLVYEEKAYILNRIYGNTYQKKSSHSLDTFSEAIKRTIEDLNI